MTGILESVDLEDGRTLRFEIFAALEVLTEAHGGSVSRADLENFTVRGERCPLIDRNRGIRNPKDFKATLSVLSKPDSPYSDAEVGESLYSYDYRSDAIDKGDNVKLRRTYETGLPFIFLRWVKVGYAIRYVPVFPVYSVLDDPDNRRIVIALDESLRQVKDPLHLDPVERRYAQKITRQRLHQPQFRSRILLAYSSRCCMCRLGRARLLDAAHIIPDADEHGAADISNGLSLCRIHHAAYDLDLIGVSPDSRIHIGEELMAADDEGPILQHGLKALDQTVLLSPVAEKYLPCPELLSQRFNDFKRGTRNLPYDTAWTNVTVRHGLRSAATAESR